MAGPQTDAAGRLVVFDRVTGEVHHWPAPTAMENIARGGDRYVHGETGDRLDAELEAPVAEEVPVPLRQEDVLDLPAGEVGIFDAATPAPDMASEEPAVEPELNAPVVPRPAPRPAMRNKARRAKK